MSNREEFVAGANRESFHVEPVRASQPADILARSGLSIAHHVPELRNRHPSWWHVVGRPGSFLDCRAPLVNRDLVFHGVTLGGRSIERTMCSVNNSRSPIRMREPPI